MVSIPLYFSPKTEMGYMATETSGAVGEHLPMVHGSETWVGKKTQRLCAEAPGGPRILEKKNSLSSTAAWES